jgi:ABC-type glycerol-3-phosphate transport system permease component
VKKVKEKNILSKRSPYERILFGIVFVIFAIYALSLLFPLSYLFTTSLKESYAYEMDIINGKLFALPKLTELDFMNYSEALNKMFIMNSYGREIYLYEMFFNSIWYTLGSSFGGVLISSFTAYALAKYKFVGRNAIYAVIIFTMTIPIMGSMGSTLKLLTSLNIYNTPFMLITALSGFGFNFMILYGFFKSLPWSYAEAVFIDGGGHFTAFFKIMLPQAKAAITTLVIMAGIGAWNDYTTSLLYMPDFPTIASGLYRVQEVAEDTGDIPMYFAGLTLSIVPVIVLFSCCSDTIMKNFTMGGLKG